MSDICNTTTFPTFEMVTKNVCKAIQHSLTLTDPPDAPSKSLSDASHRLGQKLEVTLKTICTFTSVSSLPSSESIPNSSIFQTWLSHSQYLHIRPKVTAWRRHDQTDSRDRKQAVKEDTPARHYPEMLSLTGFFQP